MTGTHYPRTRTELTTAANGIVSADSRKDLDAEVHASLRKRVLPEATEYIAARTALTAAEGVVEKMADERDEANENADADMAALFAMVKRNGGTAAQQTLRSLWGGEALHELLSLDDEVQTQRINDLLSRVDGAGIRLPRERADAVRQSNAALAVAASNLSQAERAVEIAAKTFQQAEHAFKQKYRRFVRIISSVYGASVALDLFPLFPARRRNTRAATDDVDLDDGSAGQDTDAPVVEDAADPMGAGPEVESA